MLKFGLFLYGLRNSISKVPTVKEKPGKINSPGKSWKSHRNLQKNESYGKKFYRRTFKNNSFILKTLKVIVLVRFFALANRLCQLWAKVISGNF